MTMLSPQTDRSINRVPRVRAGCARRRGFTLLEFSVAMVLFGIALAGIYPLAIMHSRIQRELENRYATSNQPFWKSSQAWYLVPSTDTTHPSSTQWARKLGAATSLLQTDPGPLPAPPNLTADDGDVTSFSCVGTWILESNPLAIGGSDYRHPAPSSDTDYAQWQFTGVAAGWYFVEATWTPTGDPASTAQYAFYDGATNLGAASASQQYSPAGATDSSSRNWQVLAELYFSNGATIVQLRGQADGDLIADGVRLVPVERVVQINSLDRSLGAEAMTAHITISSPVP
jgi:prepilin-type N-terminal cleavage/methylation domain-containing protein